MRRSVARGRGAVLDLLLRGSLRSAWLLMLGCDLVLGCGLMLGCGLLLAGCLLGRLRRGRRPMRGLVRWRGVPGVPSGACQVVGLAGRPLAGRHADCHGGRSDHGDGRSPERHSGRAADKTVSIAEQGSGRSESGLHNEPSVGRPGEALGGDPGATSRCGTCGCGKVRGCDAEQGAALRCRQPSHAWALSLLNVNALQQPVKSGVKPQNV